MGEAHDPLVEQILVSVSQPHRLFICDIPVHRYSEFPDGFPLLGRAAEFCLPHPVPQHGG